MTRDSPRELEHEIQQLKRAGSTDTTDGEITVEWAAAEPGARPEGMTWDSDANTLRYDLWAAQEQTLETLDSDTDITAFLAGYGSGKTIFGARWLIKNALETDESRFLGMGIDFSKARDTTFRVLFEQLPGERTGLVTSSYNGPETSPVVSDYNRQNHRLTLINDTVITLGSADKWNRYAGDEYGGVWLDEPSHYGEDLHALLEMMGSRLRGVDGPKVQLWTLTGNGYNAAWRILEEREDKNGDPIGLNIDLVRASTLENPYLTESDKDRFERQYQGTSREEQALYGGFAAAEGLVYSNFSRDTHVIPHSEAKERLVDGWRIYGYDAGWNHARVVLELGKTEYDQLVVFDEFHRHESHVEDAIRWLEQKPQGVIYSEHEPSDIEKFKSVGWQAKKANKSIDSGIAEVRRRFQPDGNGGLAALEPGASKASPTFSWDRDAKTESSDPVEDKPGLLISETCENLIRELQGYKEEHVGTSQAVDDCCDALRYACMGSGDPVVSIRRRNGNSPRSGKVQFRRR